MKRKLISWITILTFAMTIFPVLPHAAEAEPATEVYLGDTQLESGKYYAVTDNTITESTSENYNVYYVDGTLTLQDLTYSGSGNHGQYSYTVLSANGDITLVVEGDNTITNNDGNSGRYGRSGMYVEGNLTIQGAGDLIVNAGDTQEAGSDSTTRYFSHGLDATGTLTFSGAGHVNFIGGNMNNENTASAGICAPVINVNGTGTLEATGGSDNGDNANTENWGIFGTYYDGDSIITVTNGKLIATTGKTYSQTVEGTSIGLQTDSLVINGGQVDIKTAQCASGYGIYIHASDGNELNELSLSNGSLNIVAQGTNYSRGIKSLTNSADALFLITGGTFVAVSNAMAQDTMAVDLYENEDEFKVTTENRMWRYEKDGSYIYSGTVTSERHTYLEIRDSDGQGGEVEEPVGTVVQLGNTTLNDDTYYSVDENGTISVSTTDDYDVYYNDGVLKLNNLTYSGGSHKVEYGEAALSVKGDIVLELNGENTISNTNEDIGSTHGIYSASGLYIEGDLTIKGDGNLTLTSADVNNDGGTESSGTTGLNIYWGSLIFEGSGTVTAYGGDIEANNVQSYGISVLGSSSKGGGEIIVNGSGTLKGIGGNGDGTHEDNFSKGISANEISVSNGSTIEGIGGTTPDRGVTGQIAQDSSSTGLNAAYVTADNGIVIATGGVSQASWGLYSSAGFGHDNEATVNKIELNNNSSLTATAKGTRSGNGIYHSGSPYDKIYINNSVLIADSGAETATNSIYAMYDSRFDERFNKADLMWRYAKDGEYVTNESIAADKYAYFEIRDLDPEEVNPGTSEEPDTPDTPSTPSGPLTPSQPSEPEQSAPDVTTDGGTSTTTTTAKPDVTTSGTTASATVSEAMGEAIVEQATENESNTVVIAPEMDSDITEAEVVVPAGTVEALGDDTDADLIIDTPVGKVTLPNSGLSALAKDTDDITVSLKADGDAVEFVIAGDAGAVATVNGGVKLVVPADTKAGTVAVIVNEDGTREVVRKSVASGDNMIIPLDGSATIEIVDNSKDFVDIAENSWYGDAVAFASSHELFNGTSATEFSPDAGMTRGMLAAVLSNLERGDGSGLAAAFDDVADDAWYAEAVAWAAENGIVNGLGNGMFGPEELITREQMAAMLYNYADMLGVDTSARANLNAYSDADSVSSWANEVMSWANATGIIGGTTTTTLDPQGTATRAQVAAMLERFVLLIAE